MMSFRRFATLSLVVCLTLAVAVSAVAKYFGDSQDNDPSQTSRVEVCNSLQSSIADLLKGDLAQPPEAVRLPSGHNPYEDALLAELIRLQGDWTLVSIEIDGQAVRFTPNATRINAMVNPTIQGDTWIEKRPDKEPSLFATFKLVPVGEPKQINLMTIDKKEDLAGIYKLEEDTLTLCITIDKDTPIRPTRFTTKHGYPLLLCIYKRKPLIRADSN